MPNEIRELVDAMLALAPNARAGAIDALRRSDPVTAERVESLVVAAERGHSPRDTDGAEASGRTLWIGGCEVLERVGVGGSSVVYLAVQSVTRRRVAIKVLHPGLHSTDALRRFEREAQTLARLDHPGVARVYDFGIAHLGFGPQPYIVMEFVEGRRLDDPETLRSLDPLARVGLIEGVAETLAHVHDRQVIHRDVKPANILITRSGDPVLVDFGVARSLAPDATRMTRTGDLLGTPRYMSPEQARRDSTVDARADVYALGVVAWELLAGEPSERLAIRRPVGSIPRPDIERVIRRAMAPRADDRYPSASAFADALRLAHAGWSIADARAVIGRRLSVALVAAALVIMVGFCLPGTEATGPAEGFSTVAMGEPGSAPIKSRREDQLLAEYEALRSSVPRDDARLAQSLHALAGYYKDRDSDRVLVVAHEGMVLSRESLHNSDLEENFKMHAVDAYIHLQDHDSANELLDGLMETYRAPLSSWPRYSVVSPGLGPALKTVGRLEEARRVLGDHILWCRQMGHTNSAGYTGYLRMLGGVLWLQGETTLAEPYFVEAVAVERASGRGHSPNAIEMLQGLAVVLRDQGRLAEAEDHLLEVLRLKRTLYGTRNAGYANTLVTLANLYQLEGESSADRIAIAREGLELRRVLERTTPEELAEAELALGVLLMLNRQPGRALPHLNSGAGFDWESGTRPWMGPYADAMRRVGHRRTMRVNSESAAAEWARDTAALSDSIVSLGGAVGFDNPWYLTVHRAAQVEAAFTAVAAGGE